MKLESANNAGDLVCGLSGDNLVSNSVLRVRDLVYAELPDCSISVVDANDRVKLVRSANGELRGLDKAWQNLGEVESLEKTPSLYNGYRENSAL